MEAGESPRQHVPVVAMASASPHEPASLSPSPSPSPALTRSTSHLESSRIQHFEAPGPSRRQLYQRRHSDVTHPFNDIDDLQALAHKQAVIHYRARHRKSLNEVDDHHHFPSSSSPRHEMVTEVAATPLVRKRSSGSPVKNSATDAAETKDKRYAELMERFQIRRVASLSPSVHEPSEHVSALSARRHSSAPEPLSTAADGGNNPFPMAAAAMQAAIPSLPSLASRGGRGNGCPEFDRMDPFGTGKTMRDNAPESSKMPLPADRSSRFSLYWRIRSWRNRLNRLMRLWATNLSVPISPISWFSRIRMVVLILALTVHVIVFPVEMAFFPHNGMTVGHWIEMVIELTLLADFVLMFNTAFFNKRNVLVNSRREIAKHYLRGWFAIDFVSSIPVDTILALSKSQSLENRWFQMVCDIAIRTQRHVHIIRVAKYMWTQMLNGSDRSIFAWLLYSRHSHLVRIVWIVGVLVLTAHYLACGWRLLSPSESAHANGSGGTPLAEYIANLYDVLQLLQGQGIATTTVAQNIFATVALLIGSIALAIVFGHVAILVANFNANSTSYQRKMESVFAVMNKLQLPTSLRERVHQYYEHLWREYESLDGEIVAFSKGLSHTLELEVVLFKYMDLIMHVPFWSDGSPDFQKQLMLHLHVRVYLPDDFIIRRGEVGDEFFMINRGVCELVLGPDSFECTTDPLGDEKDSEFMEMEQQTDEQQGLYKLDPYDLPSEGRKSDASVAPIDGGDGNNGKHRSPGNEYTFVENSTSGRSVRSEPSKFINRLRRGQSFGEIALVMNYERTANVRALTYVEMCVLQRTDFQAILVKHPKDRKHVLTSLLTKTMENNEATQVWCPLRATVQSVFGEIGIEDGVKTEEHISAMHAALLISTVINLPLDDDSIKFGVGSKLRNQLVALRDKQTKVQSTAPTPAAAAAAAAAAAKKKRKPTEPATDEASVVETIMTPTTPATTTTITTTDTAALATQVQQMESIQLSMASTMLELTKEVRQLHHSNRKLQQLLGCYENKLAQLGGRSSTSKASGGAFVLADEPTTTTTTTSSTTSSGTTTSGAVVGPPYPLTRRMSRKKSMSDLNDDHATIPEHHPHVVPFTRIRSASLSDAKLTDQLSVSPPTLPGDGQVSESSSNSSSGSSTALSLKYSKAVAQDPSPLVAASNTTISPSRRASFAAIRAVGSSTANSKSVSLKNLNLAPPVASDKKPSATTFNARIIAPLRSFLSSDEEPAAAAASPTRYADHLFENATTRSKERHKLDE